MPVNSASPNSTHRALELDSLRGIAASAVVLHHALKMAGYMEGWLRDVLITSPVRVIESGRPAVIFFFVLSGYVLALGLCSAGLLGPVEYASWVAQRTVRLCVPAAVSLLLSVVVYGLFFDPVWQDGSVYMLTHVWTEQPTFQKLFRAATLLGIDEEYSFNIVLWSLVHEWRFSLALPLIGLAVFRGRGGAVLILIAGLILFGIAAGTAPGGFMLGPNLIATLRATAYLVLPFAAGAAFAVSGLGSVRGGRWHVPCAIIGFLALARAESDVIVTVASLLLMWAAMQPGAFHRWLLRPSLIWTGRISFSLYLVHVPLIAACFYGLHNRLPMSAALGLGLAVSYLGAWAFYRVVERPSHVLAKWLRFNTPSKVMG